MKIILPLFMLLLPLMACADDVEINGIYYNLMAEDKLAEVVRNPNKYSGSIHIPEKVEYEGTEYSVTSIGNLAFYSCGSLNSITIPSSVTNIGNGAFGECSSLTSIEIPSGVTNIGEVAFSGCSNLMSITIPDSVKIIDVFTFQFCASLTSITIPECVTSIGKFAFYGCSSLKSVTIPKNVNSIGYNAFGRCTGLISITVNEENTIYDSRDNCNGIIETETNTLVTGCKKTIIPNSVTGIGESAFDYCTGLRSIKIPNSVTYIGCSAFRDCENLTNVIIGDGVKGIYYESFFNCYVVKNVYCYAQKAPSMHLYAFTLGVRKDAKLYVPAASLDSYKNAELWKDFGSIEALTDSDPKPTGITEIGNDVAADKQYYTHDGKCLEMPKRGLNIIHMNNGKTKKVVVK